MSNYTIMVVDDEPSVLNAIHRIFRKDGYQILKCDSPGAALNILREQPVNLIISDYRMPDMDGVTFLREAMTLAPDTIRIILSGYADSSAIISAINDGGIYKFLTKPWEDDLLRFEIQRALEFHDLRKVNKQLLKDIVRQNNELKDKNNLLTEKIEEIQESIVSTVEMLSYLSREKYIAVPTNIERLYHISQKVGEILGLDDRALNHLQIATKLHDIGNIGVDCVILKKDGPLTPEERGEVEKHPIIGASILSFLKGFDEVSRIIKHHHESFDGTGYPDGLKGNEIPVASRVVHLIDVYDSVTSNRPYRSAMSMEEVYNLLRKGRGTKFDPDVLDIFMEVIGRENES